MTRSPCDGAHLWPARRWCLPPRDRGHRLDERIFTFVNADRIRRYDVVTATCHHRGQAVGLGVDTTLPAVTTARMLACRFLCGKGEDLRPMGFRVPAPGTTVSGV